MRSNVLPVLGLLCALFGIDVAVAAPALEVYSNDPKTSDARISPDGKMLALQVAIDRPGFLLLDLETGKQKTIVVETLKVRNFEWSGPNHILLFASDTVTNYAFSSPKIEYGGVFSIDVRDPGQPVQLLGRNKSLAIQNSLWNVRAVTGNENGDVLMTAVMSRNGARRRGNTDLVLVSGETGRGRVIARGNGGTGYWVVSPKGHVIARVNHHSKSDLFEIQVPTDEDRRGGWKTLFNEATAMANFEVYGATSDEKSLIVGTLAESGRFALFTMSLDDGAIGDVLFEHSSVDVGGIIKDEHTGAVVGASYTLDGPEQKFFENDLQAILSAMRKALPEKSVRLASWDRDRRKFVVFAEGAGDAGAFFLFDKTRGSLRKVTDLRPDLAPGDVARVRPFYYKTRDDVEIHAFLTLPTNGGKSDLPLVVMPHGGPASRDSTSFHYWSQFLASRGYAVLQMNFRGSNGYGQAFEDAGFGEWGGKMQDDITDGVAHVVGEGIADARRICIVGGSYGGYAALAGAAFTPDLYRCAISVAGVGDLERMLAWEQNRYGANSSTYEYWRTSIGDPARDLDRIRARSPQNAVNAITADVLLIHGKDDTIVPFEQSVRMAKAMETAGKPVRLVALKGEDHWLSTARSRGEMLREIEGFLAKHLGPAVIEVAIEPPSTDVSAGAS